MFGVARCHFFGSGFLKKIQLNNCFWKIQVVLRRMYESALVLKRIFYRSRSTAAAASCA